MLKFDQKRINALNKAVSHDNLTLRRQWIMNQAQTANPDVHERVDDNRKHQLLAQLIEDAAGEGYQSEELPLLLNCTIWANRAFYHENHFKPLFINRLLPTKARVQMLFQMLKLAHNARLTAKAYYTGSLQEPLTQILQRIRNAHPAPQNTLTETEKESERDEAVLKVETQSLMSTLLKEILGEYIADWRALEINEPHHLIHIENPVLHRQLLLMSGESDSLRAEGEKDDCNQRLQVTIPSSINETDIDELRRYLNAYLMDLEPAQQLAEQRNTELEKETTGA